MTDRYTTSYLGPQFKVNNKQVQKIEVGLHVTELWPHEWKNQCTIKKIVIKVNGSKNL